MHLSHLSHFPASRSPNYLSQHALIGSGELAEECFWLALVLKHSYYRLAILASLHLTFDTWSSKLAARNSQFLLGVCH